MKDTILTIKWKKEDFEEALQETGLSSDNTEKLITPANIRLLEEKSIERGWEVITGMVEKLKNSLDSTCFIPDISIYVAIEKLKQRKKDILTYLDIMKMKYSPLSPAFQKKYNAFYRVRRSHEWQTEYFNLMDELSRKCNADFGLILLRMHQATGQIEASFASKMLATLDEDMPIWDSKVLKALGLKVTGKTFELRFSNTVIVYDSICRWYQAFLDTEEAARMIERFDQAFPEFEEISATKKIDFILWASQ